MDEKIDMTAAIQEFIRPFWKQYGAGETLEVFTEAFFTAGGEINIKLPPWLQEQLYQDAPEETIEQETFGPPDYQDGMIDPEIFKLPGEDDESS